MKIKDNECDSTFHNPVRRKLKNNYIIYFSENDLSHFG